MEYIKILMKERRTALGYKKELHKIEKCGKQGEKEQEENHTQNTSQKQWLQLTENR